MRGITVRGWLVKSCIWSSQGLGQTLVKLGQLWSNSVELGQNSPDLKKYAPGHVLRVLKYDWTPLGSNRLNLGCLVLRVDTRKNPRGKNRIMTDTRKLRITFGT